MVVFHATYKHMDLKLVLWNIQLKDLKVLDEELVKTSNVTYSFVLRLEIIVLKMHSVQAKGLLLSCHF